MPRSTSPDWLQDLSLSAQKLRRSDDLDLDKIYEDVKISSPSKKLPELASVDAPPPTPPPPPVTRDGALLERAAARRVRRRRGGGRLSGEAAPRQLGRHAEARERAGARRAAHAAPARCRRGAARASFDTRCRRGAARASRDADRDERDHEGGSH